MWTLRPESRRNFQLLWCLDYASGQRESSGGGNRTAGAKGTARVETEPTRIARTLPYDKTVQAARQLAADPARYSTFLAPGVTVNGQP